MDDSMDDCWIDACQQLINSSGWLRKTAEFIDANCHTFKGGGDHKEEYSLDVHGVYLKFQELVNGIIEGTLEELGGNTEALVKALDEAAHTESSGPRQQKAKALMSALLTYEDFSNFSSMMAARQNEIVSERVGVPQQQQPAAPQPVVGAPVQSPSSRAQQLEDEQLEQALELSRRSSEHKHLPADEVSAGPSTARNGMNNRNGTGMLWTPEWQLQRALAESLLEQDVLGSSSSSALNEEESAVLVPWAHVVIKLSQLMEEKANGHTDEAAELQMQALERELADHQEQLNKLTNAKNAAEVQRLREEMEHEYGQADAHDSASAGGVSGSSGEAGDGEAGENEAVDVEGLEAEEQRLVQELQRIDVACNRYVASGRVSREVIDNILAMLGEHMDDQDSSEGHRSNALVEHADAIHDFVFARISVHDASLVPELLARLLAEEELDEVRERLGKAWEERAAQEQPGLMEHGYTRQNAWMQQPLAQWDPSEEESQEYHWYWNAVSGESQWETPCPGYWDMSEAWVNSPVEGAPEEQVQLTPAVSGYEAEVLEFLNGDGKSEEDSKDAKGADEADEDGEDGEKEWADLTRRAKSAGVKPPTRAFGMGTNWSAWRRQCGSVEGARRIVVQAEQATAVEDQHGGGRRRRGRRRKRQAKQAEDTSTDGANAPSGLRDLPHEFFCPITLELMSEPTLASDGHSYEREALEEWLQQADSSPMTGLPLSNLMITPNLSLKQIIQDTIARRRGSTVEQETRQRLVGADAKHVGSAPGDGDEKAQAKPAAANDANYSTGGGPSEEAESKGELAAKEEAGKEEQTQKDEPRQAAKEVEAKQAVTAEAEGGHLPVVAEAKSDTADTVSGSKHAPTGHATTPMQLEEERQHLALTLTLQRAQQQQAAQRQAAVDWEEQQKKRPTGAAGAGALGVSPRAPPPQQLLRAASMPHIVPKKAKYPLLSSDGGAMGREERGVHQTWTVADLRNAHSARAAAKASSGDGEAGGAVGTGLTLTRPQLMVLRRKDPPAAALGVDTTAAANPSSLRFLAGIVSRTENQSQEQAQDDMDCKQAQPLGA
jgi:hypothetical protein